MSHSNGDGISHKPVKSNITDSHPILHCSYKNKIVSRFVCKKQTETILDPKKYFIFLNYSIYSRF